ncbi:hypothetical protein [Streptomyces griseoaurantiacus]|uniref:Addiction module component n=1 Tax=Streptomyces griseoaurantiacus TaxID=68213 RepID=A0ABZ1V446_9ACTN|nr:hypothetical protein [Streptomyces jietaisiensis]
MSLADVLEPVAVALDSTSRSEVVAAAWEALDVAERVADAITFEDGSDELQALVAAQASAAGSPVAPRKAEKITSIDQLVQR